MSSYHFEKLRLELESMRRLRKSGTHPLDLLNRLINDMYESYRIELLKKFPTATREDIELKLRKKITSYYELKNIGRRII